MTEPLEAVPGVNLRVQHPVWGSFEAFGDPGTVSNTFSRWLDRVRPSLLDATPTPSAVAPEPAPPANAGGERARSTPIDWGRVSALLAEGKTPSAVALIVGCTKQAIYQARSDGRIPKAVERGTKRAPSRTCTNCGAGTPSGADCIMCDTPDPATVPKRAPGPLAHDLLAKK